MISWTAAAFLALCLSAGLLGTLFIRPRLPNWYASLRRPSWDPPQWLFAPVWTGLYLLMAAAAWKVWSSGAPGRRGAMVIFAVQLALNVAWPALFFGLRRLELALAELFVLWVAVAATLLSFWSISPLAGALLVPYLAWTTFALFLNGAYWRLNR